MSVEIAEESFVRMAEMQLAGQVADPKADEKLFVEFNTQEVLNRAASVEAGRPIYDLKDYIRICQPGNRQDVIHREVWMDPNHAYSDYHRFGAKYRAWKSGQANDAAMGTPLSVLTELVPPLMNKAQVREFQHFNVRTCEQLVAMSDETKQKFMGVSQLIQKVQSYLETTKSEAPAAQMRAELEARDAELSAQKQALKEMAEQLAELRKQTQGKKNAA